MPADSLRVIASIEAHTVTGPAKNLLRFCRLARNRADGCDISLVTYVRPGSDTNDFLKAAEAYRIPVHLIRERHAFDRSVLPGLRELFKRERPDIVQSHAVKSHVLVKFARPSTACWIAYHHGYTYTDLKMRVYNQLDRWSLPSADRVVTVCDVFRHQLTNLGVRPDRIRVLGNCIEPHQSPSQTSTELRERLRIPPTARVLVSIGRLSREKGHRYLVTALPPLESANVCLLLIGEGPERERLEEQVKQLGLQGKVLFVGHQRDPLPFYDLADVFVLPSLSEGSSNALLEAMRAAKPIVATRVGGTPETATDGLSALLVPPGDPGSLARAIDRILKDSKLAAALGREAADTIMSRFSPEAYFRSLMSIYREVCATERGSGIPELDVEAVPAKPSSK